MTSEHISTRVNSTRLRDYIGRTVRLTCKILRFQGESAIVEASDGGQVEIRLLRESNMTDTYVEIIGSVVDNQTIKLMACINLGSELDMKIVNDTVEHIHDPKFYNKMFT